MPLDPPAPSNPATDSGPPTSPAPDLPCETVWRHTFLAQFANPADRQALQRFGALLYTVTLSAGYAGDPDRLVAADDLDAVADDLDALAAALQEISEVPDHLVLGPENRDLCREARDWEGRSGDLAHEIRCRVREVEGGPAPKPAPAADDEDRSLGQDLRDSDRIARRLANHHPDPEVRRIYGQLVEHVEGRRKGRS
jgi:hypothetical protein